MENILLPHFFKIHTMMVFSDFGFDGLRNKRATKQETVPRPMEALPNLH